MAAGLGFKDFTTGEVLTAADVDGYLMQGVWVFDSAAARDAAVTSPQEGNFAYLKDTNVTTYYTGSAWTNLDTTGMVNPMTTTGDTIYSSSGSTPARLGIGTAGQVLTVNSGATAPEWATPAGGATFVGCLLYKSANQSVASATETIVSFDEEIADTDGFHDNATNNGRITIPSGKGGKYLIQGYIASEQGTNGRSLTLYKNNSAYNIPFYYATSSPGGANMYFPWALVLDLAAADYVDTRYSQESGNNKNVYGGNATLTVFGCTYLGA